MSGPGLSPTFNISTTSSQFDNIEDNMEIMKVKNYVKDILKSRIFLGRYVERRLVDQKIGYRDIVLLSPAEVELKRDLLDAKQRLKVLQANWIGISDAEIFGDSSGVSVWTEIDNQPFGPFWFQIRSVKFRDLEVIITLKCLRHISDAFLEVEPILTGDSDKSKSSNRKIPVTDVAALNETYSEVVVNLKSALSISNVKEFFTFIFAFIIAVFTGSSAFINFVGNFILALVREMSILIKNSTPMFLGFLDFLSKIVGGFYILLAMFFKPNNPIPSNKRRITHYDHPHESYDHRNFD